MSIVWQCRTFYVYYCCYWVFGFWGCRYCCIVPLLHWLRIVICGRETPKLARCYKSVNKWVLLCNFEIDFWRIFVFYICDGNSRDDEGIGEGNVVHFLPWILENGGVLDAISPRLLLAPFVCWNPSPSLVVLLQPLRSSLFALSPAYDSFVINLFIYF